MNDTFLKGPLHGYTILFENEEGDFTAAVAWEPQAGTEIVRLAGNLEESKWWEDESNKSHAAEKTLHFARKQASAGVVLDLRELNSIGLTSRADIKQFVVGLTASQIPVVMVLNPKIEPAAAFVMLEGLCPQVHSVSQAILAVGFSGTNIKTPNSRFTWAQVAGMLTLVFFMFLTIASIYSRPVPRAGRFPTVVVLSLGATITLRFLGGDAFTEGRLPIPFLKNKTIEFKAVGAVAVLLILLLLGSLIYSLF